ncbi:MAG: flagellar basal body-associated protein FliL [Syntrophorhabdus sp. PtaU1.Bin153]|nr:MAG: flagellar basal body-associated protein FliL [Syntrophorhabdus sp. PtaU1.Bin153]
MAEEAKGRVAAEGIGEGDQAEETPKKKRGKLKLFLLLFVAIVVAGGAAGYFFFGKELAAHYSGGLEQGQEKKKKPAMGPILSLEPFIFNVGGDSPRYAKIALGVELKDAKVMEEAKKMIPAMRDRVLSVLGTKGPDVLMDIKNRDNLKQELHGSLKELFKESTELKTVYITDIIIQ